ncbi:MAG: FMN-binding protein [Phycisphaerae bacterium]
MQRKKVTWQYKTKRWFPIIYMFVITAAFSAVIIGFAKMTEQRVKTNDALAFELAVLKVLPGMYDPNQTAAELHRRFTEQVKKPTDQTAGAYSLEKDGQIAVYALPFTGQGFWAPIDGVIGINADKKTVTGISIYQQRETPGLGAEVAQHEFTVQFDGLEISNTIKPISFKRPGEPLSKSEVHAVTGATQTSIRLEKVINDALNQWREKIDKQ